MSRLSRGRSRLILKILVALGLSVVLSLQVSTEPTRTGAGTVFLITDKTSEQALRQLNGVLAQLHHPTANR